MSNKRPKQESTSPVSRPIQLNRHGEIFDAQTMQSSAHAQAMDITHLNTVPSATYSAEKEAPVGQTSYASPPAFQSDTLVSKDVNPASLPKPTDSLVSPPTSLADETDVLHDQADGDGALHTPNSSSRHSSRQPRHVERYMPEAHAKIAKSTHPIARRASFGASTSGTRKTTPGPKKASSRPTSSHGKTPTADKKASASTSPNQPGKGAKRDRPADDAPDAESLRLIRELQEQEFGLRKRSTRA